MNKHKHAGLYFFVGLLCLAGGGYYYMTTTKKAYVMQIIKAGHGSYDGLMALDKAYLKEWAGALKKNNPDFNVGSKSFYTNSGKQK